MPLATSGMVTGVSVRLVTGLACGALWLAGLRLFLRSGLSCRRKSTWSAFLLAVGIAVGFMLPINQLWTKFLILIAMLPVLAAADVWLLRSGHGLSFWVRACGFEVCTVFGSAVVARSLLDLARIQPLVDRAG